MNQSSQRYIKFFSFTFSTLPQIAPGRASSPRHWARPAPERPCSVARTRPSAWDLPQKWTPGRGPSWGRAPQRRGKYRQWSHDHRQRTADHRESPPESESSPLARQLPPSRARFSGGTWGSKVELSQKLKSCKTKTKKAYNGSSHGRKETRGIEEEHFINVGPCHWVARVDRVSGGVLVGQILENGSTFKEGETVINESRNSVTGVQLQVFRGFRFTCMNVDVLVVDLDFEVFSEDGHTKNWKIVTRLENRVQKFILKSLRSSRRAEDGVVEVDSHDDEFGGDGFLFSVKQWTQGEMVLFSVKVLVSAVPFYTFYNVCFKGFSTKDCQGYREWVINGSVTADCGDVMWRGWQWWYCGEIGNGWDAVSLHFPSQHSATTTTAATMYSYAFLHFRVQKGKKNQTEMDSDFTLIDCNCKLLFPFNSSSFVKRKK